MAKLKRDAEGRALISTRDYWGKWINVPISPIEKQIIPEHYDAMKWFVIAVKSRSTPPGTPKIDQFAHAELSALSLPAYMPIAERIVRERLSNGKLSRKDYVTQPYLLFEGFILVALGGNDLLNWKEIFAKILLCRHVSGVVVQGSKPVPLPNVEAGRMIKRLNTGQYDKNKRIIAPPDSPEVDEIARITQGPFNLLTGKIIGFKNKKRGDKLLRDKALVHLQGENISAKVQIDIDSLERVA